MSAAADSAPRPRVGEYLRRLRGEKNMSLAEAAARLFLQSHVLKAMERDDYETLPEVYLRGHLRNYAKLLGAPPEEILAMYQEDIAEPEEEAAAEPPAQPPARGAARAAGADSHLAALALLVFAWWLGVFILERAAPPAVEVAAPAAKPPAPPPPPQLDYAVTTVEHPAAPWYRAVAEEAVAVGRGPDTIRMTLTEDSWIEVLDAANEKVYYDLGRAGQTLVLNGAAPFSVLLGAARGVTLEFNGTPFDVVPYSSRNNLARFVLR